MKSASPRIVVPAILVICFTLATWLQPRAAQWGGRAQSDNLVKVLLGEGRRLFANHFYTQADVVLHSGYYPSVFDQARRNMKTSAMSGGHQEREASDAGHVHDENCKHDREAEREAAAADHVHDEKCDHGPGSEHEREMAFLREPRDWIERFGRKFIITEHTHLGAGKEKEILPWLRVSAELDPQRVETYTVAAYWLRAHLGKINEAEQFLREGLRNNPSSYEILYELGCLYAEAKQDPNRARNLWDLALAAWSKSESGKPAADLTLFERITVRLAALEATAGNYERAIGLFELAKKASPHPEDLQKHIDDVRVKMSAARKPD